jgi:hypothetical protein
MSAQLAGGSFWDGFESSPPLRGARLSDGELRKFPAGRETGGGDLGYSDRRAGLMGCSVSSALTEPSVQGRLEDLQCDHGHA